MDIKRFRVFGEREKEFLAKKLMEFHFPTFNYMEMPIDIKTLFFSDKQNRKISLDYERDIFNYRGKFCKKQIWSFKDNYESEMACKLVVFERSQQKNNNLLSKLD